eukprot:TRINITY_DN496_c0_g1_i2.p1 TRINITY_DN496_c0_g1~~TRINITY_DN496_c0_g1_i2.p1  ORF type:complete len:209 (-),score=26.01 TRINITY_DN496_c0_g1_i2:107-640(-)
MPQWYDTGLIPKITTIYVVIFFDIILNCLFEPPSSDTTGVSGTLSLTSVVLFALQAFLVLVVIIVFYLMLSKTALFEAGLSWPIMKKFGVFYFCVFVNLLLLAGVRVYRIMGMSTITTRDGIWSMVGYYPLYIIQRLFSPIYYCAVIYTCQMLADPSHYYITQQTVSEILYQTSGHR